MYVIASPYLLEKDLEIIHKGHEIGNEIVVERLLEQLERIENLADLARLDLIAHLIALKKINIKIAYRKKGIYHEKLGLLFDSLGNFLSFNGSLNETRAAYFDNFESINVFKSWDEGGSSSIAKEDVEYYDRIWNNKVSGLEVIDFPEAVQRDLLHRYKTTNSLEDSLRILEYREKEDSIEGSIEEEIKDTVIPHKKEPERKLYEYQQKAVKEFVENKYRHFFEMATGTGKTFTAVKAVGELIQLEKDPFIVVLVPQIDIQYQWVYEFKRQGFDVIFTVGGKPQGITNWEQVLANNILDNLIKKTAVIYVAVYDSFFSKMVQRINRTEKLCLIVDEAHNLTPGQLSKLPDALYRLGLSATPERHDPAEGVSIIQYFIGNGRSTYKYSLKEAIDAGFLSKYEYHPLVVYLNEDEYASYKAYSARIGMLISQPDYDKLELQALLNQRSVIVKKASGKLDLLKTMLISGNYTFKNSVVYCGQGKYGDSDIRLIDLVTQVLYESKYRVSDFTSETEDRRKVLEYFEEGYFDTLAALKCFDEGVDVPKLERIFIMSSDSLIRQTIQRRGRVLRICKESGKTLAYIYDMIVLPPEADCDSGSGISLVSAELKRVKEYASLSVNQAEYASLVTDLEKRFSLQQQLQEPNTGIDEEIL